MAQFTREMYRVRITRIPLTDNVTYEIHSNEFSFPSGYKTIADMARTLVKYFEDPIEPGTSLIDPIKGLDVSCRTPGGFTHYNYIDFYCAANGQEEIRKLLEKSYFRVPISDDEAWIVEFMNYLEVDLLENSCNSVTYYFKGEEYIYEFPYNKKENLFHRDAYEEHVDL